VELKYFSNVEIIREGKSIVKHKYIILLSKDNLAAIYIRYGYLRQCRQSQPGKANGDE